MKTVVYAGTKNLYADMIPAMKSLLDHTAVDEIILLSEHDSFPYDLPSVARVINVAELGAEIFGNTPNWSSHWTYMALMRIALTKILPDRDVVLSLDVDTIVADDISELWHIDMSDYYFALAEEATVYHPRHPYYNFGISLQNLAKQRADGIDDKIIAELQTVEHRFPEQDVVNEFCTDRIYELPARYNDGLCCGRTDNPAIIHYAGFMNWQRNPQTGRREWLRKYRNTAWEDIKYFIPPLK